MDFQMFSGEEVITGNLGGFRRTVDLAIAHDEYPNDKMGFNPAAGGGGFNFDQMLTDMKTAGQKAIPVLARKMPYLNVVANEVDLGDPPYDNAGDPSNPMHYRAMASFYYQFAARYGANNTIPGGNLKLRADNTAQVGLDLVYAVSINNESDRDWGDSEQLQRPKEMAAMLSAAIDGHMGQMGATYGCRQADPNMKIMMNGLIEQKVDYIKNLVKELKALRKDAPQYGFPINPMNENFIIDVHQYPTVAGNQTGGGGGIPVEDSDYLENADRITKIIRMECPNAEISLTESGYDSVVGKQYESTGSDTGTPLSPSEVGTWTVLLTHDEAQAKHMTRLSLYSYIGGYSQFYWFTLKDPQFLNTSGYKSKFNTSGLFQKTGPDTKKVSWYAFKMLRTRLAGYSYVHHTIDDSTKLHKIIFKNGTLRAYALWLGKNVDAVENNYVLDIDGHNTANKIEYALGVDAGNSTSLTVTNNTVTVNVTEKPFLVLASTTI